MSLRIWCRSVGRGGINDKPLPLTLSDSQGAERLHAILDIMLVLHPCWSVHGPFVEVTNEFPRWELVDEAGRIVARFRLVRDG